VTATIATIYRPSRLVVVDDEAPATTDEVIDRAVASGDEHAIKFTEVAIESHPSGNTSALAAAARAVALIDAE